MSSTPSPYSSTASSPLPPGQQNHPSTSSVTTNTTTAASKSIPTSKSKNGSSSRKVSATQLRKKKPSSRLFTPAMQDAQARGKNPNAVIEREDSDEDEDEDFFAFGRDDYERKSKMQGAAYMLDNPELVMMQSMARGDSIPSTRHAFAKMMCGYFDPNDKDAKIMDEPPESEREKERQKAKPIARDWDRQGRDWGAGT